MASYKIVKDINIKKDIKKLYDEVFIFSHYQQKGHHFKTFMNELVKHKSAMRNKGGGSMRFSRIGINYYFVAWIDEKKNTLFMKHVSSGSGWPRCKIPKSFQEQDDSVEVQEMEN
jgi:hypothetical protein